MFKKVISLFTAALLSVSLVACGNKTDNSESKNENNKIVVWTLAEDLKTFAEYYTEKNSDKEVEVVVIAPADYPTKLTTALRGKSKIPDVIVEDFLENDVEFKVVFNGDKVYLMIRFGDGDLLYEIFFDPTLYEENRRVKSDMKESNWIYTLLIIEQIIRLKR